MFLGRHAQVLDVKGRLALLGRERDAHAEGIVLTRGIDRCPSLSPLGAYRLPAEKVVPLPISDPDARHLWRLVSAEATDLELDGPGSPLLPPKLRHDARLERETLVIGVHGHLEFWSPEAWAAVTERLDADAKAIVEQLTAPI
jgi:MraZ protein